MGKDERVHNRFESSIEGYREAKQYLQSIGKWYLAEKELSMDGWTVICLANSIFNDTEGVKDKNDD